VVWAVVGAGLGVVWAVVGAGLGVVWAAAGGADGCASRFSDRLRFRDLSGGAADRWLVAGRRTACVLVIGVMTT
jgi:hypothetical protein